MQHFNLSIQVWYRQNYRNLPWRNTKNPYKIWLSEVILQQTRVEQGLKYYNRFISTYPTVKDLAAADEQQVLRLWQGLGYYSRARNLHTAAKQVMEEYNGVFPNKYKEIKSLKGVGDYTAAAIASFAFDLPYAVLDGNVFRVLSRFYNDDTPIDTPKGKKLFQRYADDLLSRENPAEFNQAIMELGALVCKPKNPACDRCPIQDSCLAVREGDPLGLPVKSKKTKVTRRYFHYFIADIKDVQLVQRKGQGIWKHLYQFPLLETEKKVTKKAIQERVEMEYGVHLKGKIDQQKHILSHQHIDATFWVVNKAIESTDIETIPISTIDHYPLPRLIERFIEENETPFHD